MTHPMPAQELLNLIHTGQSARLQEAVDSTHPAEMADLAAPLDDNDIWQFLRALPLRQAASVFANFTIDRQIQLAENVDHPTMARMLEGLPPDDRTDLVQEMDPHIAEQILSLVAKAEREDIRKLASFEEGSAGAIMNSDYAKLAPELSVTAALQQIRIQAPTRETIYYIYVVNTKQHLVGLVSLKDLILAHPTELVSEIMSEEVISVDVNEDQELVAQKIEKFDLLAIPVIDGDKKLVGIITYDDALDVIRQEQQEDVEKFMAIGGRHEVGDYLRTSSLRHFRNRVVWVVILGIFGLVSGVIVQNFEGLLLNFAILVAFMPMLTDTGGNTGSQSATLMVRSLALGDVQPKDFYKVVFKEFKVSLMLAMVLALVAFARVMVFGSGSSMPQNASLLWLGITISIALGLQVITATLIGAVLPIIAVKLKRDPAIVACPALTTIVDITGLLLFFGTAKLMLGV